MSSLKDVPKAPDTPIDGPTENEEDKKVASPTKNEEEADKNTNRSDEHINESSFNPHCPEGEESEILERLRGDAIGSTLYSERFVISTLMKLREMKQSLEEDEKLEADLESLWDMTIEKDVVSKLVELEVFAIFTQSIVEYEKDSRLIEIIVGITANMCNVSNEALLELCKSETTVEVFVGLIACGDTSVLTQLMRLLMMAYSLAESAQAFNIQIIAYPEFFPLYCFILNSSNDQGLLELAQESLNAILAKCATVAYSKDTATEPTEAEESCAAILKFFINPALVASTIEAFRTLCAKQQIAENDSNDETDDDFSDTHAGAASESLKKTFIVFLNVHEIFLNYKPEIYNEENEADVCDCFNVVLKTISTPEFVLPANRDFLQDILETLLPFYATSKNFHNEETVLAAMNLWRVMLNSIHTHDETTTQNGTSNDFECDEPKMNDELNLNLLRELSEELLDLLMKLYTAVNVLKSILGRCRIELACQIFKFYGVKVNDYRREELELDACCTQLSKLLNSKKNKT